MNINEVEVDVLNAARNNLTEFTIDYKYINQAILACYAGFINKTLASVAQCVFMAIIRTRCYSPENRATKTINESKRIFNDSIITLESLLKETNSIKYADGSDWKYDESNLAKRIRELHEANVIYFWKFNGMYMFFMEREIGSWKYYNPDFGYVTPRTIKKIIVGANDMIKSMKSFFAVTNDLVDESKMKKSFCLFLKDMIAKMNPATIQKIQLWDGRQDLEDYLIYLNGVMANIDDFDGLVTTHEFNVRLPPSVSAKFEKNILEKTDMKKKKAQNPELIMQNLEKALIKDLTPKNPIIAKKKRGRKPKIVEISTTMATTRPPAQPESLRFDTESNPFKDGMELMRYYRHLITLLTEGKARFESFEVDGKIAVKILDTLIIRRNNNKLFLDTWIRYFFDQKLKGEKAKKSQYVSMDAFFQTLDAFSSVYQVDNDCV